VIDVIGIMLASEGEARPAACENGRRGSFAAPVHAEGEDQAPRGSREQPEEIVELEFCSGRRTISRPR